MTRRQDIHFILNSLRSSIEAWQSGERRGKEGEKHMDHVYLVNPFPTFNFHFDFVVGQERLNKFFQLFNHIANDPLSHECQPEDL